AALLIAQSPSRWQRHSSRQLRVTLHDLTGLRPGEQVEVDLAKRRFHLPSIGLRLSQVPGLPRGVVPKEPGRPAIANGKSEGNRNVKVAQSGMDAFRVGQNIDVPELADQAAFVKRATRFTQTKD